MMTGMLAMGIGQGVQPLLGYCVGAKNWERYKRILRFALWFAFILGLATTALCYLFSNQIIRVFLTEKSAFAYALNFAKILLVTSSLFGVFYVLINALQAMGAATASLIINLSRQGILYIPALFILNKILGVTGLVWAQPVADMLSISIAVGLYVVMFKKITLSGKGITE